MADDATTKDDGKTITGQPLKDEPKTSTVQATPDSANQGEVVIPEGDRASEINPDVALLTVHATATDGQGVERIVGTPPGDWRPAQVEASEAELAAAKLREEREKEAADKRADLLKPIDTSDRKVENP